MSVDYGDGAFLFKTSHNVKNEVKQKRSIPVVKGLIIETLIRSIEESSLSFDCVTRCLAKFGIELT